MKNKKRLKNLKKTALGKQILVIKKKSTDFNTFKYIRILTKELLQTSQLKEKFEKQEEKLKQFSLELKELNTFKNTILNTIEEINAFKEVILKETIQKFKPIIPYLTRNDLARIHRDYQEIMHRFNQLPKADTPKEKELWNVVFDFSMAYAYLYTVLENVFIEKESEENQKK